MKDLIDRLEELAIARHEAVVAKTKLENENATLSSIINDLRRTNDVLAKTCKFHNDFFDELGIRAEFQKYFDEKVEEEQKNE